MHTVVVESPAKAKTINKYLGKDYTVVASFGHVRDLLAKDGSVRPEEDFAMDYEADAEGKKHISAIVNALKGAETLYLATDPDREGEAISWHVVEALKSRKALPKGVNVQRIVFHEITKGAVTEAIQHPRDIDMDLVNAQQARRALDYLVGFNLSPVLWRKLPGAKSAGRVQSVALRLICERDEEIERFISREYWDVTVSLRTASGEYFSARLTEWEGKKLEKFSLTDATGAQAVAAALERGTVAVTSVEPKQKRRHPYPPFTTSTLQMDASRRLGFGAKKTMSLAQKLYEGIDLGGEAVGLITYMRTDGVTVSKEAITATRALIGTEYGAAYLPDAPRQYTTKAKNAQEAHEAIRPTDLSRTPQAVRKHLEEDQFRLYELIWKRMVASQMEPAVYDQVAVECAHEPRRAVLRATGSVLKFDGFLKLYREGLDDDQQDEEERRLLPALAVGEGLDIAEVKAEQHFTEPPPRYSEASLVKRLEELGIGRPSTYASIISVLQDRGYVRLEKKRFIAEMRGRLVSAFLESFFPRYVEYDFTARLEEQLDEIADGKLEWKSVLREFWGAFLARVNESKELPSREVLKALDASLARFIFGKHDVAAEDRACPACSAGELHLKTGKYGAFLGCTRYPECNYTRQLNTEGNGENGAAAEEAGAAAEYPKALGTDDESGESVSLRKGPYGLYVQSGEGKKPRRVSLPAGTNPEQLTLAQALALLSLPRELGVHPETDKKISAGIGRFGPYLLHDGAYTSLKEGDDVLTIGMNRAVTLIAEKGKKKGGAEPLRILGEHPEGGGEIALYAGRYGPYVKHGKINASLGRNDDQETLTLARAAELLAARAESSGTAKPKAKKKRA
jgi:DNA topoisomerase-1